MNNYEIVWIATAATLLRGAADNVDVALKIAGEEGFSEADVTTLTSVSETLDKMAKAFGDKLIQEASK